ncbi:hypothetical protein NPIL_554551 [Nephila pilipes]|uniref:Uncharacterized protein n=1 Tax=Nephila pilipes TaxID=299642 RepID=A0A8X6P114_NEPPI|nr:hypothetical protein NPIL_554551 [Nephila pilipes]
MCEVFDSTILNIEEFLHLDWGRFPGVVLDGERPAPTRVESRPACGACRSLPDIFENDSEKSESEEVATPSVVALPLCPWKQNKQIPTAFRSFGAETRGYAPRAWCKISETIRQFQSMPTFVCPQGLVWCLFELCMQNTRFEF